MKRLVMVLWGALLSAALAPVVSPVRFADAAPLRITLKCNATADGFCDGSKNACAGINCPSPPPTLVIDPTCAAFAVPIDVRIGTPFAGPSLTPCFSGAEAATAAYELLTRDASPSPTAVHFAISAAGVISNDGVGVTAQVGNLWIRRVTKSNVAVEVSLPWRIRP